MTLETNGAIKGMHQSDTPAYQVSFFDSTPYSASTELFLFTLLIIYNIVSKYDTFSEMKGAQQKVC